MKCFRCGGPTREDIFIHLERKGSSVKPKRHSICSDCAVEFWRWVDEPRTILTHERVLAKREGLEERERKLRQREVELEKMRRQLKKKLDLRELEVLGEVR